jgi:hypothetical protein
MAASCSSWTTEYRLARLIRARKRARPDRHPDRTERRRSKLSRYGLAGAKHVERLVQRPTLTALRRDDLRCRSFVAWDQRLIAKPEGLSFIFRTVTHRRYS